ncbi:MAG: c-type cytochrome, partial [Verrucomicrobiales bacterium]|nr:c-type cytochrome [Verrucomicrobiales bacterium]
ALVRLSKKDANDDWIRLAILSSVALHAPAVLARLLADDAFATSTESSEIWAPLARMVGAGNPAPRWEALLAQLAERKTTDRTAMAVTRGLAAGLRAAKAKLSDVANRVKGGSDFLESQMLEAGRRAVLRAEEEPIRVQAIELLENASFETASPILESLLASDQPSSVHSSAAKALSAIAAGHPEVGDLLLSHWSGYSGEMRSQVVQLLLAKKDRLGGLLDALASGLVQPYQIGPAQRDLLLHHEDPKIRTKAESVFAATECRHLVVEQYKKVPQMNGDPAAGKTLFNSVCIACHKFYDSGVIDLAPNLAVVADWEPERILVNILDPNREVAPEFMEHVITTTSGDVITGRVTAESSGGISLKLADNSVRDIRREDIRRFENTGRSLMPEGLEAAITPKAMADLIAFLKSRP